jgi:hypothetical protein
MLCAAASNDLRRGVDAYNAGDLGAAVTFFQQAVREEPASLLALQHLANARLQQTYTAKSNEERENYGGLAEKAFLEVLARDSQDALALWSLTNLEMQIDKPTEAAMFGGRFAAAQPQNKAAWYTLGVIRWMAAYRDIARGKKAAGIAPGEAPPIRDAALREKLRQSTLAGIAEGRRFLEKALALDPRYADALAYDSLLYRSEAELAATPEEAGALLARADERVKMALEAQGGNRAEPAAPLSPDAPPPMRPPVPSPALRPAR